MNTSRREFIGALTLASLGTTSALAQTNSTTTPAAAPARPQQPPPVTSPQVHEDGRVTIRYRSANAKKVEASGDWTGGNKALEPGEGNVWSVTFGPLPAEVYGYGLVVDGLRIADPANPLSKPSRTMNTSVLDIPGKPPLNHDWQDVPHGTVHQHQYISKATGAIRRVHVYTPPGYGTTKKKVNYPVLYLLHGSGDNDSTWVSFGRAPWIADNLIAQKKCVPMVIVMTDGHAVERRTDADRSRNIEMYEKDLLESVIPLTEANYTVKKDAENRAIIGLSMGGQQSLVVGIKHADKFAWVGGMSSAVREPDATIGAALKNAAQLNKRLKVLWFACGIDDFLLNDNRKFDSILNERGIRHGYKETPGNHSWPVWRKYLAEFLPMIFTN
ncbi:MAG: putative esterase [Verrucomicrobia bacterium]|jgi:enterochelin esterase family protein|nr:putative esterase [Verrucomicrobiota bacterium]